jgi:hypothetical protein
VEKGERIMSPRRRANATIICDMITLQIRLRAVLARLEVSRKPKACQVAAGARAGIEPARSFRNSGS